jgi:hypothetical protein
MEGMNRATAALFLAAAKGVMPTPPDLSSPSEGTFQDCPMPNSTNTNGFCT